MAVAPCRVPAQTNQAASNALDRAIAEGVFREVGGVIYDLRKPQPGWTQFNNVKVVESALNRTVVNVAAADGPASLFFVRNLPKTVEPGQRISFLAKPVGSNNTAAVKPPRNWDAGVVCKRADIPEPLLTGAAPSAPRPARH